MVAQLTPIQTDQPDPSQYGAGYFERQLREARAAARDAARAAARDAARDAQLAKFIEMVGE